MVNKTTRTKDETIKTILGVQLLNLIKEAGNDVMATRSLTTRQDDTYVHLLRVALSSGHELYERHTIGIGEQLFDFFLVCHALRGSTLFHTDGTLKRFRQLGLVGGTRHLQCTFFHNLCLIFDE